VRFLKAVCRQDEFGKTMGELRLRNIHQGFHWTAMRTRQHLPSCNARVLPNYRESRGPLPEVTKLLEPSAMSAHVGVKRCRLKRDS
jgi:hypothetical protein